MSRPALLPSALDTLELIISPAMPAQSRAEHVDDEDQPAGLDAGQPAGLGVAADRLDQQAERGAPGEQRDGRRPRAAAMIDGHRDAEPVAGADHLVRAAS